MHQAKGTIKDEDSVKIFVRVDDEKMEEYKSKDNFDLSTDKGQIDRINYASGINKKIIDSLKKEYSDFKLEYTLDLLSIGFSSTVNFKTAKEIATKSWVKYIELVSDYKAPEVETSPSVETSPKAQTNISSDLGSKEEKTATVFGGFSLRKWADFSEMKPSMIGSNELVQTEKPKKKGYNGKNQVVAIVDTGVELNHEAFEVPNDYTGKLSEQTVNDIIKKKQIKTVKATSEGEHKLKEDDTTNVSSQDHEHG